MFADPNYFDSIDCEAICLHTATSTNPTPTDRCVHLLGKDEWIWSNNSCLRQLIKI